MRHERGAFQFPTIKRGCGGLTLFWQGCCCPGEELAGKQEKPIPSPFNLQRAFHFPPYIDNYPS